MADPANSACPVCKYDLTGVDAKEPCPECGTKADHRLWLHRRVIWRAEDLRHNLEVITIGYVVAMMPSCIAFVVLVVGFTSARMVGVDHTLWSSAEHPWLDLMSMLTATILISVVLWIAGLVIIRRRRRALVARALAAGV